MAYKTFANGFPLPASDLNNYLMNQSVIVFADSTARTAALPTPTEGMVTYLEDTNLIEVYNGSAWVDINDNTAAIPKSTVTTAGDLIVADGASSVTRLGAGADGSLLTVDTGSPAYLAPGTDDQVLTLVSGAPAWADAGGGGGGFNTVTEITASNATYDVSAISGFAKFTIIGGGGGAGAFSSAGSAGGSSSIVFGGTTITAAGGGAGQSRANAGPSGTPRFASGNHAGGGAEGAAGGGGGRIKVHYENLTSLSTINITIGGGGGGSAAGGAGAVIMEYAL